MWSAEQPDCDWEQTNQEHDMADAIKSLVNFLPELLRVFQQLAESSRDYNDKNEKTEADMRRLLDRIGTEIKDPQLVAEITQIDPELGQAIRNGDLQKIDNPAELQRLIDVFSQMRMFTNDQGAIKELDEAIQALSTAKVQMQELIAKGADDGYDNLRHAALQKYEPLPSSPGGSAYVGNHSSGSGGA
jgi:hypothetical protein